MHTFWRSWLAGQRCRCWREGPPGQIPVGRRSWGVVTCFFWCFRWWGWSCDCQPSPWSCGPCVYQAAIAAACRWGRGAMQCRRLLWDRQTHIRSFFNRKAILDVLCQQGDLVYGRPPVLKLKTLLLPREQWVDTRLDESLEDFKGDAQQRCGTVTLWVLQWLFWLRDRNY